MVGKFAPLDWTFPARHLIDCHLLYSLFFFSLSLTTLNLHFSFIFSNTFFPASYQAKVPFEFKYYCCFCHLLHPLHFPYIDVTFPYILRANIYFFCFYKCSFCIYKKKIHFTSANSDIHNLLWHSSLQLILNIMIFLITRSILLLNRHLLVSSFMEN